MLLQTTSAAQNCADLFPTQQFECDGPGGCSEDVVVNIPNGSEYGLYIHCGSIDCCGQLFTTCGGQGNCEPVKLRPPEVKERLTQLSRTSDVLVADCSGRYGPYDPVPRPVAAIHKMFSYVALDDDATVCAVRPRIEARSTGQVLGSSARRQGSPSLRDDSVIYLGLNLGLKKVGESSQVL